MMVMSGIAWNAGSPGSSGGTEQMGRRLERSLPAELLEKFQIHLSHREPAIPGKIQLLWCHLPVGDGVVAHLADGSWRDFDRIVFCGNWQAQGYITRYGIPWSKCVVLPNGIEPVPVVADHFEPVSPGQPIKLIFTPVPSRGLLLLYHVFKQIAAERDDVELDVYSSFRLYGWLDQSWEQLFAELRQVPRVTCHGVVPNEDLRAALARAHVFGYPAMQEETASLALIEAMSAGLACVHPNLGALYETAGGMTLMYQWHEDPAAHALVFYQHLTRVIGALRAGDAGLRARLAAQKSYADARYDWGARAAEWQALLCSLLAARSSGLTGGCSPCPVRFPGKGGRRAPRPVKRTAAPGRITGRRCGKPWPLIAKRYCSRPRSGCARRNSGWR
jgi:UDP-glucose:(glucosyl)LPS alpha-1,2-glucosyltransferase